ncbi:MAG: (Fe-S)-binding protein [Acidobacteriota bacterium]|nr:MAG: (Fe-S)-binding protein [Acidobacteriota bacterium]
MTTTRETEQRRSGLTAALSPASPLIDECVHCGFCLPACPTYVELGRETDSPRGRIYLVRALSEGRIGPTRPVLDHLDRCLDCRACETACPSGVRYAAIIERTRAALEPERQRSWWSRACRNLAFRHLLPSQRAMALAVLPLRAYTASGLAALVSHAWAQRLLPRRLRRLEALAPRVRGRAFSSISAPIVEPPGERRGTVALFTGCVMDHVMAPVHRATVAVLSRHGFRVLVVSGQTCCGALHAHNGELTLARELARCNVSAFEESGADRIIVNAAGCGAQLVEYGELLDGEPRAARFSERVVDLTAFLTEVGLRRPERPVRRRAVYDAPCHLHHAQRVTAAPLELLSKVPGLELVELPDAATCCGSAGIYNLLQPAMAERLLARKLDQIEACGADLVVSANPGCQLQLEAGLRQRGLAVSVAHVAEVLAAAYDS